MMLTSRIIVRRKKTKAIFSLTLFLLTASMFLFASVSILVKEKYESEIEVVVAILIIAMFLYGLFRLKTPLVKIFSKRPEFEVTKNELIINDNPKYSRIIFSDIHSCGIYKVRYTTLIGIFLNNNSFIEGNSTRAQRALLKTPKNLKKIVFLDLEFAAIKPKELKNIIDERISIRQY